MTTKLDHFRLVAVSHLAASKKLLTSGVSSHRRNPSTAAYLATVSLECVLKARILYRANIENDDDLRRKLPDVHRKLFTGASGHAVGTLAQHLRLEELLKLEGKSLPDHSVWTRLCHAGRPYSLRYGVEDLSVEEALAEVRAVESLHEPLLSGLRFKGAARSTGNN